MAGAIDRDAGVVEIDAVERGREAVRVALPAHLAVADHVDAGFLHVSDREQRGVVLSLLQEAFFYAPELSRAHARRKAAAEAFAVDQPFRLWIAAHDRGREKAVHEATMLLESPEWSA